MSLDAAWALDWTRRAAVLIAENRTELTELDRAIGDADHGDNLDRGMRAVVTKLDAAQESGSLPSTPGGVLKVVATTLMATVGGAGGPLLGTAFLKAARSSDAPAWGPADLVRALAEATSGLEARGHATSGDKTMADAWRPAAVAAKEAEEIGEDEVGVLTAAAQAAAKGAQDTEPLQARRGRASFLGERSCGHRDPGAQSSALILQAAVDAARDRAGEPAGERVGDHVGDHVPAAITVVEQA
ncbi:dihydroxyacetone kinase subunit DhaL [Actinomyces viscosus]|uniref:PTS-dependent dihydroxyacetone kinase, ADP-binding subunit dhaL n=1 Tax=Actinomyces viscosus TaxID=1656 RepID=A0A3S4Z8A3_ACTVI|nr:dihydroxyacetone kinase subunit DhaL [Actinomyces viscosus]VEI15497.1 PTS-dependent dihydroxyacetone kinase, ADP-binding subunit dhaL [Actinomyces viscosus]